MSDQHPADEAFEEVQDALMKKYGQVNTPAGEAMRLMRDRWIEADEAPEVSVPNKYVEDGTL